MKYVGTWRVSGEKHNRFSPSQFSVDRVDDADAHAILRRLQPELAGSGWERNLVPGVAKSAKVVATPR